MTNQFLKYTGSTMPLKGIDGVIVINLKRRADRLQAFFDSSGFARTDVHVQEAYDSSLIATWDDYLETLFGENTYNSQRGAIGAAISHYNIWMYAAATESKRYVPRVLL